ncbi:glycosyltransferase family 92 protein [bacterium]|nr:glycosyltransferase family 92 protein [bacterium]
MSLPVISKNKKRISSLLTFWIPLPSYRRALRGILQLGVRKYFRVLKSDRTTHFEHELAIGAIMKDEGPYLKEWLDFHILVGVTKFYLYDNESGDNTHKILEPYIDRGIVEYTWFPGKQMQAPAYKDILNKHANDARWMALIDLDEFLVPVEHKTIPEFLHSLPGGWAQLIVTWVMYGSSGHKKKPEGMVMENYKYHANDKRNSGIKPIINPRLFLEYRSPHMNLIGGFTIDNNGKKLGHIDQTNNPPAFNKLRCNHYYTKSFEDYMEKYRRGASGCANTEYRNAERFKIYDRNEVYDTIMDKYVNILKKK